MNCAPVHVNICICVCTDNATSVDTEELMAELELMKNMEPHENILNLLGQCTTPGNRLYIHEQITQDMTIQATQHHLPKAVIQWLPQVACTEMHFCFMFVISTKYLHVNHEAAIASLPHPQSWAEPQIHIHIGKSLPSVPPSPEEHNLSFICPSTPLYM